MQWILDSYGMLNVENRQATVGWVTGRQKQSQWEDAAEHFEEKGKVRRLWEPAAGCSEPGKREERHSWSFWGTLSIGGWREPQGQNISMPQVIMAVVLQHEEYLQTVFSHSGFVRNVFPCPSIKSSLVIKSQCSTNLPLLVKISCKSYNLPHPVRFLFTQSPPPPPFLELDGLKGLTLSLVSFFFFESVWRLAHPEKQIVPSQWGNQSPPVSE